MLWWNFASSIIITITPSSKALPYYDFRHNSETIIGYYGKSRAGEEWRSLWSEVPT
jgi:hypothetical protein